MSMRLDSAAGRLQCAQQSRQQCLHSQRGRSNQHGKLARHVACRNTAGIGTIPGEPESSEPASDGPYQRTKSEERWAKLRGTIFLTWSMAVAVPLCFTMLVIFPLVWLFDRHRRRVEHKFNKAWAWLSTAPFNRIRIEGWENVPSDDTPAIYCANHESYMDIFTLFHLGKDFKFVSKPSIFMIPIVGWSMWLTGHVSLNRKMDAAGFRQFIAKGKTLLKQGASMVIFPEGTRSKTGKLADFKKGAFTIATQAKVSIIPISILRSGDVMPPGKEGTLSPGDITMVVHKPINTKGKKTAQVSEECRKVIASVLPAWKTE